MTQLNIHMTFEQFDLLFRALDPLNRGVLSFESLYRTVLPQGSKAQANRVASACSQRQPPTRRHSRLQSLLSLQPSLQLPAFAPALVRNGSSVRFGSRREREEVDEWAAAEGVGSGKSFRRLTECDERDEQSFASGLTDVEMLQRESYLSISKRSMLSLDSMVSLEEGEEDMEWPPHGPASEVDAGQAAEEKDPTSLVAPPLPPGPSLSSSPESTAVEPGPHTSGGRRVLGKPLVSHASLEMSELVSASPVAAAAEPPPPPPPAESPSTRAIALRTPLASHPSQHLSAGTFALPADAPRVPSNPRASYETDL